MRRATLAACSILFSFSLSAAETGTPQQTSTQAGPAPATWDVDTFTAYLDGLTAAQFNDYRLAGMTFVLVREGEVALARGYGYADLESATPVDPARHLFRPGSVSKLFTWTAVMQLMEQGRLDLNADVSTYVDQFEVPQAFGRPLTLRHLLSHTPGLEDGAAGFLFADEPDDLVPLAESLAAHIPTQVRPPLTHASYSNWGTALAGLIVANVSGQRFEDYVDQHIFEPLGMLHATFHEPLPEHLALDMATGYTEKQGALAPFGFEYIKNFGPAGALSATSTDLAHFMIAHLQDGRYGDARILETHTAARMHSALFSHDQRVAAMAHGFYEIWRNGQRFIGHGGDTIAFHSEMVLDPGRDFGFFLSFNAADGGRARAAIVNGVIDYFYPPDTTPRSYPALEGSAARIAEVVGSYRFNRRSYTKLEGVIGLAGDASVIPAGDGAIQVPVPVLGGQFVETEPYVFTKVDGQERLVFARDAAGQVTGAFVASLPIMVADRVSFLEAASTHQLVILLALLASVFVLINAIRNRRDGVSGSARTGRWLLAAAAAANLLFVAGLAGLGSGLDMEKVVFDFPPPGTGFVLLFPVLAALFTALSLAWLIPVWRTPECTVWARLRYTYVAVVFTLFVLVMHYWNILGWRY